MASLPTVGGSAGTHGTVLNEYLTVEHNADGTHAIKWPVNGTDTRIYTKYLTGTMDSDASTSIAHGVTAANILSVNPIVHNDSVYKVVTMFGLDESAATDGLDIYYDATNIVINNGTKYEGQVYRIKIDYLA